jgi:hypothetical protein
VYDSHWRPILDELARRIEVPDVDVQPVDTSAL